MERDTNRGSIVRMLKADIVGEHEAIRQYNSHINLIPNERIVEKLKHIRDQELHHVKELETMLKGL